MKPIPVLFKVDRIICHKHRRSWKGDQPYMWNVFFNVGGEYLTIEQDFRLSGKVSFHFSEGSHNNLGIEVIPTGEWHSVPQAVGEWKTTVQPLMLPHFEKPIPGIIGCLTILMEKNNLSEQGAEAAHQFINGFIDDTVDIIINGFDPRLIDVMDLMDSIKNYFESRIIAMTEGIEKKIGKVVIGSQSLIQNIWTLIDKDVLIGYHLWDFSLDAIEKEPSPIKFQTEISIEDEGHWEIQGYVRRLDTPTEQIS